MNRYLFTLLLSGLVCFSKAQVRQIIAPGNPQDSVRTIQIVQGKSLRFLTLNDSTKLQTIAKDVIIKEGLTTFYCDSAALNEQTKVMEAFGNIHINDNDSIHTYAQYLKYIGKDRMAYLKKNVKLTDKKGILLTDQLEYDLRTGIAKYFNGGKIINGKTELTSKEAVYYSDTKDVFFKKTVHLVDPERQIWADSIQINLNTNIATFIAPTHIVGKDGSVIDTKSGTYNLNTGEANFYERTLYKDSTHTFIADKINFDKKTGFLRGEGRARFVDSVNKVTTVGGLLIADTKKNSFLATQKPVMIFYRDNDSTYIAADTLFSGLRKYDSLERRVVTKADTLNAPVAVKADKDSSIRYFLAFHHVRVFNDSLQAVSDSLHYSTVDSTFKLFGDPVVWNDKTQLTGDTIYMYTENSKAKRVYVFNNGMLINQAEEGVYDQIAGRTLNGYFVNGQIDHIRVKGSPAESIFYPQDDDSAFVGMNRSSGDVIEINFVKKELNKVKFINKIDGVMYPISQTPGDQKRLKNFKWLDQRRPKNKLELFE